MKSLDPNSLFSAFESGDEEVYKEHGVEDVLNNPYVIFGMVVRGLENYFLMDMMYSRNYPQQYQQVKVALRQKYLTRLYNYLLRVKLDEVDPKYKIGETYELDQVFIALEHLLSYFSSIEHYEKCKTIKQYQDFIIDCVQIPSNIQKLLTN